MYDWDIFTDGIASVIPHPVEYFFRFFIRVFFSCTYFTQNQPPNVFFKKSCSEKFRNIHRKTPVLETPTVFECWSNFIKKWLQTFVFLWILQNF